MSLARRIVEIKLPTFEHSRRIHPITPKTQKAKQDKVGPQPGRTPAQ